MITFQEARQRVLDVLRPEWRASQGTLIALPGGYEDATHWRVIAGARERLIDGDLDFDAMDMPAWLVGKHNGAVTRLVVIASLDRLNRMTPTA
jgi:hypothetical protein